MPGGNGAEGARVVVEAGGVVDAGRFGNLLAIPPHAFDRVVEPPRWPKAQGRIVTRERRELTRIGAFVEREQHHGEARVVAVLLEQGPKVPRVLRGERNVGSLVHAEALEHHGIMVAECAGMELHHEAILRGETRHLHQHVRLEAALVVGGRLAVARALEQALDLLGRQLVGIGLEHAMVGGRGASARRAATRPGGRPRADGRGAQRREILAPVRQGAHQRFGARDRDTARARQGIDLPVPGGHRDTKQGVRPEGRHDAPSSICPSG